MYLDGISINNFRNYKELNIEFKNNINIFIGNNAQGKTNLLEAIYFLALGKSLRNYQKEDLVNWDKQHFYIKGNVVEKNRSTKIEIGYSRENKKIIKINSVEKKNFTDLLGIFNVVIFTPEDLLLVKGGPNLRRDFIDQEISQLFPVHSKYLYDYGKLLFSRNKILKSNKQDLIKTLDVFDIQMASLAAEIIKKRVEVLEKVKILASLTHRKLTNNEENLIINYSSLNGMTEKDLLKLTKESIKNIILKMYGENKERDLLTKVTSIGPHRDDLIFQINGKNAKKYCSQGQQRTLVLSLKLAELELFMSHKGSYPVLLLDDVLSELDEHRRNFLIKNIKDKIQTFITTTDNDDYLASIGKIYTIKEGVIS